MAGLPQAPRIAQLAREEQYTAAELFRGTMLSHSAVVHNENRAPQEVSFAGDAWTGYVPLRMSDTKCIQERLPPGAAAVLLYPGHTFTDLVMPIDATELSLFTGIDGTAVWGTSSNNASLLQVAGRRVWRSAAASSSGCGGTTRWSSTRQRVCLTWRIEGCDEPGFHRPPAEADTGYPA